MASVEEILHFLAQEVTEDSSLPTPAQVAPPPPPPPRRRLPKPESPQQRQRSIPTSVIRRSCIRSTNSRMSSSSSPNTSSSTPNTSTSTEYSEEEQVSRKRVMPISGEAGNGPDSKVIRVVKEEPEEQQEEEKFPLPDNVVRVIPLRPICGVYMLSYGQEDSIDKHAGSIRKVIEEPFEGLPIDLSMTPRPILNTIAARMAYRRKRRELEQFIFADRYKTVWFSYAPGPDGNVVKMTVPFTVDVADVFNSFTATTVPQDVKDRTYQYAMDRAEQLSEFTYRFSMNNPNAGCFSSSHVDLTKYDTSESRIVWAGRHPQVPNARSA